MVLVSAKLLLVPLFLPKLTLFVSIFLIQTEGKNNSEDLYEEVSAVKASIQSFEGDDLPTPPATSPPPPPKSAPTSSPGTFETISCSL